MPFSCPLIPCLPSRTKIVCTLGPSTDAPGVLEELIQAGISVARLNFSHGTPEENTRRIRAMRIAAERYQYTVGILADLQGPKLRIGEFVGGRAELTVGSSFRLVADRLMGDRSQVWVPHPQVLHAITPGSRILLGDGDIELLARELDGNDVLCEVLVGGTLASRKGITLPGVRIDLPALTAKDERDLDIALREKVDFIAMSFVQDASDIVLLQEALKQRRARVPIVAKIERRSAADQIDEIVEVADAVMVARGDLGLEMAPEEVPMRQKAVIATARAAGRPVITATQMLESMMTNPRPTRAEASDVANAIIDGTDAVMLSGETAAGRYPVEAVRMMSRIAQFTEAHLAGSNPRPLVSSHAPGSVTAAISQATCHITETVGARAIVAATMSGWTAQMVARERPSVPIVAMTPRPEVVGWLTLVWGVAPILTPEYHGSDDVTLASLIIVQQLGLAKPTDLVVLTAGMPLGGPGRTNMVRVHRADEFPDLTANDP